MASIAFGRFDDSLSAASLKAYLAEFISTLFVFAGVGSALAYGTLFFFNACLFLNNYTTRQTLFRRGARPRRAGGGGRRPRPRSLRRRRRYRRQCVRRPRQPCGHVRFGDRRADRSPSSPEPSTGSPSCSVLLSERSFLSSSPDW